MCPGHRLLPQGQQVLPATHYCEDAESARTNAPWPLSPQGEKSSDAGRNASSRRDPAAARPVSRGADVSGPHRQTPISPAVTAEAGISTCRVCATPGLEG